MSFDFMMSNISFETEFRHKEQPNDDNRDLRVNLRSLTKKFLLVLSAKVRGGVM
jgi:hypothetical protein